MSLTYNRKIELLHALAESNGAVLFGTCDVQEMKKNFLYQPHEIQDLNYAVVFGIRLSYSVLQSIENAPTLIYKLHHEEVNRQLDRLALLISMKIHEFGYQALPVPASYMIDPKKLLGHVSHRHIAVRAGLGWIGRNNRLVTKEYGSQIRLCTVLTTMSLPTPTEQKFGCGDCKACIPLCPAKAIWNTSQQFDLKRCYEQIKTFRKKTKLEASLCGICTKACPGESGAKLK